MNEINVEQLHQAIYALNRAIPSDDETGEYDWDNPMIAELLRARDTVYHYITVLEKCNCENEHCENCRANGCSKKASRVVRCDFIGNICDQCAKYMPGQYLHTIEGAK